MDLEALLSHTGFDKSDHSAESEDGRSKRERNVLSISGESSKSDNPPHHLPPSVEAAYHAKCIALKRRINEIEETNDSLRLRKTRINRAVLKMRLERAFLLEQLQKRMQHNMDESDRSTSPPPTPQDKPLRSKRSHRQKTPTLASASAPSQPSPPRSQQQSLPPLQAIHALPPAHSPPEHRRGSGLFFSGPSSLPPPAQPSLNGLQRPGPPLGPPQQVVQLQQPGFYDGFDERRPLAQENGVPAEYGRPYAAGVAGGEAMGAVLEGAVRAEANGERRAPPDTEMGEAQQPGFGGGFTAVNR